MNNLDINILHDLNSFMELSTYKCLKCDSDFYVSKSNNVICPYCLSPLNHERLNVQKPELIINHIDIDKAFNFINSWYKKFWFIEKGLKKHLQNKNNLKLIYIPFWIFDIKTVNSLKIKNNKSNKKLNIDIDDLLAPATKSYNKRKLNNYEPWNIINIDIFNINKINDEIVEISNIDSNKAFELLKPEIENYILDKVESQTNQIIDVNNIDTKIVSVTTKSLYIPIWITTYKYKNEIYNYMINSQTGEIIGETIKSLKIF